MRYEPDEVRTPLHTRVTGEWTAFEARLFNLVTESQDRLLSAPLFSKRLAITQAMLDAYDRAVNGGDDG